MVYFSIFFKTQCLVIFFVYIPELNVLDAPVARITRFLPAPVASIIILIFFKSKFFI